METQKWLYSVGKCLKDITNASADVFPLIERIVSSCFPFPLLLSLSFFFFRGGGGARRVRPRLNPRLGTAWTFVTDKIRPSGCGKDNIFSIFRN